MGHLDQAFLEYVLGSIVEFPENLHVIRTIDEMGVLLTVQANKADMARIIGKEGKTAVALRVLLRVIGSKINARVNMKILEPEVSAA